MAMDPCAIECVHYNRDEGNVRVMFASGESCQIVPVGDTLAKDICLAIVREWDRAKQ